MLSGLPPFNDADQIVPGVWLGNARAAADETFLKNAQIQAVFNCTKDLPFHSSIRRRYRIPVDDNLQPEEIRNLELWSYEIVVKMMREIKEGNAIFVHCHAGMQRSPAVIAMFLIATMNMNADQAMAFIKDRRPIVFFPTANFGKAIRGFEESFQKLMMHPNS
jgi:dual specificity MAP kinase phosphatase